MNGSTGNSSGIDACVLDLGRVLIDIDFERVLDCWAALGGRPADALRQRFTTLIHGSELFARHERGELACEVFFAEVARLLELPADVERLRRGWNAVFTGEVAGVRERLAALAGRCPVYVLTNTNASHTRHWREHHGDLLGAVRRVFVSSEIGMRKPEPAIYAHVASAIGCPPGRIAFVDDNAANVAAALAAGWNARHVRGPAEVPAALDGIAAAL
jgi:putative hydrolase of the HAD superfamily